MHGLLGGAGEYLAHRRGLHPHHLAELGGGVVADPLADGVVAAAASVARADLDRLARLERARDVDDADRQQRRPALAQRPRGAAVDGDGPARGLRVLEPQLEARVPYGLG